MLKSEVKNLSEKKELPFPKLMINNATKTVICATKMSAREGCLVGFVVYGNSEDFGFGGDDWYANLFTDFYGSVTLTQTPE